MTDEPVIYRTDDPLTADPRFLRRVLAVCRPIPIVSNIHEVKLECGHEPLLLGGRSSPQVGDLSFCPSCYELAKES
ncbi:MAG TPA: hypothetical protein VNW90_19275 [Acetobacteraceae bacterium]|jgi:hypothetical protein|nr:hypothetical protein [Acetobacteraceae bacterium]